MGEGGDGGDPPTFVLPHKGGGYFQRGARGVEHLTSTAGPAFVRFRRISAFPSAKELSKPTAAPSKLYRKSAKAANSSSSSNGTPPAPPPQKLRNSLRFARRLRK